MTPGEVLEEEFLKPLKITQYRLAKDISVPARRINEIIHGTRTITADTAIRLARYFGTSERFWLNLQTHFDIESTKERLGARLQDQVQIRQTYSPSRLFREGKKLFVQMEDGRTVRVSPKAVDKYGAVFFDSIYRFLEAQGREEAFRRGAEAFYASKKTKRD